MVSFKRAPDLQTAVLDRPGEARALTRDTVPAPLLPAAPLPGAPLTDGGLRVAPVWACVSLISNSIASLPLVGYARRADGGRDRVRVDVLDRPSPAMSISDLLGTAMVHLLTRGNAYLGKFRDGSGALAQLGLIHPERVLPRIESGVPRYEVLDGRGGRSDHGADDIVPIRSLSQDGVIGLSPVTQCRLALGVASALAEHGAATLANDGRPSGIVRLNSFAASESTIDSLKAAWESRHAGVQNAGKTAVVAGEVEYLPVGLSPDDLQFVQSRELSDAEVARIFNVPASMIGAKTGDSLTYSSVEQQSLHYVTYTLAPWLRRIESALSNDADVCPGPTYCEFLVDALLRSDAATRAGVYEKGIASGWLTVDEVRRRENLS